MTVWKVVLLSLGVIVFLFAVCALVITLERKYPSKDYDERQLTVRGNGYRLGFCVGIFCQFFGLIAVILYTKGGQHNTEGLLLIGGCCLLIPAAAFFTYCLLKDALLPRWGDAKREAALFGVLAAAQFTQAFSDQQLFSRKEPRWFFFIAGIFFVYLAALHIFYFLRQRRV